MSNNTYNLQFSVDSTLLRELGERLVGQPHIALAELVKNAYDADANRVEIRIDPAGDFIEVRDNGHGMGSKEFERFWMRIGSPHKQEQRYSPYLERPMTGSKGVGRLAVQFLSREIELRTVSRNDTGNELRAFVDWDRAITAGELTRAEAEIREVARQTVFPEKREHGTVIVLRRLSQTWDSVKIEGLAKEIWWLQPPFEAVNESDRFTIDLATSDPAAQRRFKMLMRAVLDELWHARLQGRLVRQQFPLAVKLS